jgi:hypothetical protein
VSFLPALYMIDSPVLSSVVQCGDIWTIGKAVRVD